MILCAPCATSEIFAQEFKMIYEFNKTFQSKDYFTSDDMYADLLRHKRNSKGNSLDKQYMSLSRVTRHNHRRILYQYEQTSEGLQWLKERGYK